jgi:hypothetical protein
MVNQSKARLALGCVMVVVGVGVALAQKAATPPSEEEQSNAIGSLRSLNTAEAYYAKEYARGYSPSLAALSPPPQGEAASPAAANLIDPSLTGGHKANYVFTYTAGAQDAHGQINSYTITARPAIWQKGVPNLFTDQTAVLRWSKENRAATVKDPEIE